tara:strand:- start:473 stop:1345 length:873 start_codon:yes stop_codon:yes gene_type:complete
MEKITNETFGKSKAIHSPTDMNIKKLLTSSYGSYVESTDENEKTMSVRRRIRWENCQAQIRNFLEPLIDLSELQHAYPTNGIHESIDWMCVKVKNYQVFEGEYRYSSFMKKPIHVASSVNNLKMGIPLYMSNPFSATGNFDRRYDEAGSRQICPIYLDLAFVGTTGPYKINLYENVEQVFWSCSKPYGLGLLRAGVRFSRKQEPIQQELQGVGYFNHAMIDVFKAVTMNSSVFAKKEEYQEKQNKLCEQFNLEPSDSYLIGTTQDEQWDRFKRENGINRVCLTPAYERME